MKYTFLFICLCITLFVSGQTQVELQLQLLTPDVIGEATIDQESTFPWMKEVNNAITAQLEKEKGDKDILVFVTIHRNRPPEVTVAGRPEVNKNTARQLTTSILKLKSPKTKYSDYSFAVIAKVNEGGDKSDKFLPAYTLPDAAEIARFQKLEMGAKLKDLQTTMREEILPIAAVYETTVDAKFKGVLRVGKFVSEGNYVSTIEDLTDKNPDYWRAVLEMSSGNQLIPFTKACMHIEKGELGIAQNLLFIMNFFSEENTLPAMYMTEISRKIDLILADLTVEINKGMALHDKGKYNEAIKLYENLLKTFPYSAWLNYELYFSKAMQIDDPALSGQEWDRFKSIIYACDPMYPINAKATSGKEGYLLFRRHEVANLFKEKDKIKHDIVEFADIAFELENYSYAAQIYWLILSYFSEEEYGNRNMLAHFLYCLDKLGDQKIKENFTLDTETEFKKLEQEHRKVMEESSIYQSFKEKE
ncbi:MAG: hypothetical protein KDD41_12845 [Flavobacteriales bacterium]|nr:hypothetical protein [Flavobacteriales bacterium]